MTTTTEPPYSHVAPDAEFIGAGDEVVVLKDDRSGFVCGGILVDVDRNQCKVNIDDSNPAWAEAAGTWVTASLFDIAHPDSPQAQAVAVFGTPEHYTTMSSERLERLALNRAVIEALELDSEGDPLCPWCGARLEALWADNGEDPEADHAECERCDWDTDEEEVA